jgi:TrmH family RNA methyltransferase
MVAWQRWEALERTSPSYDLCWVALAGIQYPGNLGTILRVSDAVGGDGVILLGTTTDPYDPLSVRASKGAICTQRLVRASLPVFSDWKRRHNCTVIGTSPSAETDYRAFSYPLPVALLMGCERNGLTGEQQALCDIMVRIPMVGRCDSLNVAVAAGVMLYELFNQRHSAFSSGG